MNIFFYATYSNQDEFLQTLKKKNFRASNGKWY